MCQFLQSQAWREETASTIGRLSEASADAAKALEEAAEAQVEF